jgi:hypothetical protein
MRERLSWIGRALFGAGVAVVLVVGTAQALASSRALRSCESCIVGETDCDACCQLQGFEFGMCPFNGSECLCW